MGLLSFLKDAGAKVFGGDSAEDKAAKIKTHLAQYNFDLSAITITVSDEKVTLTGKAKNLDEKQKIVATAGNIEGVSSVEDQLSTVEPITIAIPDFSEIFYTVKSGDTLSKIAKEVYEDSNKYAQIFDANKPMLSHPDKIYPGQVLYIPQG